MYTRGIDSRGNKVIRETAKSSKAIHFRRIFVIRNVCRVTVLRKTVFLNLFLNQIRRPIILTIYKEKNAYCTIY
jgi:hypothetical protein